VSKYFEIYRGLANKWECDIMGHLNVQFYTAKVSDGLSHFRSRIGLTPNVMSEHGIDLVATEGLNRYRRELHAGDALVVEAAILDVSDESVEIVADIVTSDRGELSAGFDMSFSCRSDRTGQNVPWPTEVRERLEALRCGRRDEPRKPTVGLPGRSDSGGGFAGTFVSTRGTVMSWECAGDGRMALQGYMARAASGIGHVKNEMGFTQKIANENSWGSAALEYKIDYLRSMQAGDIYSLESGMIDITDRLFRFGHSLRDDQTGEVCAVFDVVGCMFDLKARRMIEIPAAIRDEAERLIVRWPPDLAVTDVAAD
jgi:acyl-CoA thioester hydrolase